MIYDESDLIQAISAALLNAQEAKTIAEHIQEATEDRAIQAKLNLVKERAQLIVDFLGDDAVTDIMNDLDALEPVIDHRAAERKRLHDRLLDDLDPGKPTCISFLNAKV